jgi:hypothetical protein
MLDQSVHLGKFAHAAASISTSAQKLPLSLAQKQGIKITGIG